MIYMLTTDNGHRARAWSGRMLRLFRMATPAAMTALLSGCIILDLDGSSPGSGSGNGSGKGDGASMGSGAGMGTSTPPAPPLPPPAIWRVELPVLDADQQKRADEVSQYLAKRYQALGWKIVDTTQTFIGDIMDWLDPASVPGSQVEPPPKPTPEEMKLPDGVELLQTELDLFPELRGPEGTIPVIRPSFAAYISGLSGASSIDDFLASFVAPGDPAGPKRLYAGIVSEAQNQGALSWINAFGGPIEPGTMSLLEMAVVCRNLSTPGPQIEEQIGIAASRDWSTNALLSGKFGDSVLRIQVEFLTHGNTYLGDKMGGWDGMYTGFARVEGAPYAPGMAIPEPSTIGGIQHEALYHIQLANGNWWVGWNGAWLGYYPTDTFPNELKEHGCETLWYGEVYDPKSTPLTWTWTDMGSGQFASAGFGKAAYFRNPTYVDPSGASQWPDKNGNFKEINNACYTRTPLLSGAAPWDRGFYVGGPGGLRLDGGSLDCHGLP